MTFPGEDPSWPDRPRRQNDPGQQPEADPFGPWPSPHEPRTSTEADFFARDGESGRVASEGALAAPDEWAAGSAQPDPASDRQGYLSSGFPPDEAVAGYRTSGGSGRRVRRVAWELLQTLALAVLIFLMVRAVVQNFRVEGPSMEPGLHNGQYLLVNKAVYLKLDLGTLSKYIPFIDADPGEERFVFHGPQRGDVVVFRYPRDPSRDFIKRVIGVPGDVVSIDNNGIVSVNGTPLEESYAVDGSGRAMEETMVPPRSYFVLGDNRPNSSDSRNWGFVPEENIVGKAMLSYWPLSELGGVGNTRLELAGLVRALVP